MLLGEQEAENAYFMDRRIAGKSGQSINQSISQSIGLSKQAKQQVTEQIGVERGSSRRSSFKGREEAIVNQTNIRLCVPEWRKKKDTEDKRERREKLFQRQRWADF